MRVVTIAGIAMLTVGMSSCASVTMIGAVRVHGDLHGLSATDIRAAITALKANPRNSALDISDVEVISPTEVRLYWGGLWGEYASYVLMKRVRAKWVEAGGVIVTA